MNAPEDALPALYGVERDLRRLADDLQRDNAQLRSALSAWNVAIPELQAQHVEQARRHIELRQRLQAIRHELSRVLP